MAMQKHHHTTPPAPNLSRTRALLEEVYDALEKNAHHEEAQVVFCHLRKLSTPQLATRIENQGIEPVLAELAQEFVSTTAVR
jgi:hypothetical protein